MTPSRALAAADGLENGREMQRQTPRRWSRRGWPGLPPRSSPLNAAAKTTTDRTLARVAAAARTSPPLAATPRRVVLYLQGCELAYPHARSKSRPDEAAARLWAWTEDELKAMERRRRRVHVRGRVALNAAHGHLRRQGRRLMRTATLAMTILRRSELAHGRLREDTDVLSDLPVKSRVPGGLGPRGQGDPSTAGSRTLLFSQLRQWSSLGQPTRLRCGRARAARSRRVAARGDDDDYAIAARLSGERRRRRVVDRLCLSTR